MILDFVNKGWKYHDQESERLSGELESLDLSSLTSEDLTPLLALSNHTMGEHRNEWERAYAFAQKAVSSFDADELSSRQHSKLAVAAFMSGDVAKGHFEEAQAVVKAGDEGLAAVVEIKVAMSAALIAVGQIDDALHLFNAASTLSSSLTEKHFADRAIAISANNLASDLLRVSPRTDAHDELITAAATLSLAAWRKCGTWINAVRGLYLLQYVENERGRFALTVDHGLEAIAVLDKNGGDDIEEAFIRLELARALHHLGENERSTSDLNRADDLSQTWEDKSLVEWYQNERSKYF
ncbi:hypothetical protein CS022_05420 [Veronia nyctiphanis]|uniref:MalT-like TPR region domain-containing protein n=1 Tax=Veronia nyctiphanis TaxID=1278244 RepID=A0A4Q0YXZ3_9GAMM|nr:hypothetical protein [Veronia nyctiphanis]RXJ74079.1 hypothetical protein CS022_05420 [Veronia nyctiphanis]